MNRTINRLLTILCVALWASALSAQTHWTFDYRQYQYDMSVYFTLQNGEQAVTDLDNYEVAAFVGSECRGVGLFVTQQGITYGYLRVYSNTASGETVTFKCYDKSTGEENVVAATSVPFVSNDAVGLPSSPFILNIGDNAVIPGDVNDDGFVDAADVSAVINHILGRQNTVFNAVASDVNGDGFIDASDVSAIINVILGR